MKAIHRTKKIIIVTFLLSLLFHISSILYILLQKTEKNNLTSPHNIENLEQKIKKHDSWAETKARASDFGTPVIFQDEPICDNQQNQEESSQPYQETIKPHVATAEIIPEPKVAILQEPSEIVYPPKNETPFKNDQQKPQQKKSIFSSLQSNQTVALKKSPLSLAQLTQGFLNHVKNEGNHTLSMIGKKNSLPSDEQIKYERYLQKLSWCLQNSFSINNHRFPQSVTTELTLHVFLALNKDGTMKQVYVSKSSGNMHLDNFTLFIFNDASSSFPPVPQYLPHDPFTITYVVTMNTADHDTIRIYRR